MSSAADFHHTRHVTSGPSGFFWNCLNLSMFPRHNCSPFVSLGHNFVTSSHPSLQAPCDIWEQMQIFLPSFLLKNIWTQANFRGKHDNVHETLWFPSWHSKFSNITGSFYKQHAMYMFSSAGEMPWLFLNKQQHDSKASAQCVTMMLYCFTHLGGWFGPMCIVILALCALLT